MTRVRLDHLTLNGALKVARREHKARFERMLLAQIKAAQLPKPEQQYRFAGELGREWRADFAWPEHRLLLEVNGGLWQRSQKPGGYTGGGHSHPMHIARDWTKHNDASLLRWFVLQVTTDQVRSGAALTLLTHWLTHTLPLPATPPVRAQVRRSSRGGPTPKPQPNASHTSSGAGTGPDTLTLRHGK